MPKVDTRPVPLKQFESYGVMLNWSDGHKDAIADCPFCGEADKFSLKVDDGRFQCWSCKEKGNTYSFLRLLWEHSDAATTNYNDLMRERGLLFPETLMNWGVARSILTNRWLMPGYSDKNKIKQLYRYEQVNGKGRMLAGAQLSHQLHGLNNFDTQKHHVYVCEGPWDAMVWQELLERIVYDEANDVYRLTASKERSMMADSNVLAVPGCRVRLEKWSNYFADKSVYLMYDNDHPRRQQKDGTMIPGEALEGARIAAIDLLSNTAPPEAVYYLKWGDDGYDPDLPSGYDLRDLLTGDTVEQRLAGFKTAMSRITQVPSAWMNAAKREAERKASNLKPLECTSYSELYNAWSSAMVWTEGLNRAFIAMLSSVVSTKCIGDQLWFRIMGPAACGKSTLCEALTTSKKFVLAKSVVTGFHSGFKTDADGDEDHSLVAQWDGKTLITKDGDCLLTQGNLPQILSQARDIYDGVSRTHYRNAIDRTYEGLRMTWILCGTSSLRQLDSSELGERFLNSTIMDTIDTNLERSITYRVAKRAFDDVAVEYNGSATSRQSNEMTLVMQLTGGYVNHLRYNATRLIGEVVVPVSALNTCARFGRFVAYMRARPSLAQDETSERELSSRLTSQFCRLSRCAGAVLNKSIIDDEVTQIVHKIAMDTARGQVLRLVDELYYRDEGVSNHFIQAMTGYGQEKAAKLARFLSHIGITETFKRKRGRLTPETRIRLTDVIAELYEQVALWGRRR